jgi:hypothetical protein
MSFTSEFKSAAGSVKSQSQKNIGGGYSFFCTTVSISRKENIINPETEEREDRMIFPLDADLRTWLTELHSPSGDLAFKELSPQALKNMELKGIKPKKQPCQIMNILVTMTDESNIVLVHFPTDMKNTLNIETFLKDTLDGLTYDLQKFEISNATDYLLTFKYENTEKTSFKESAILERLFFQQLRKVGLMKEDDEED